MMPLFLEQKHQAKIEKLIINGKEDRKTSNQNHSLKVTENTIINLSSYNPNNDENLIPSLGLNFAMPVKLDKNGVISLIAALEIAIKKAKIGEVEANVFRTKTQKIISMHQKRTNTVHHRMKWMKGIVKNLQPQHDIILIAADKGNCTVIMNRKDYDDKIN
ncbi:unnamed protein product [Orchesella dallaii]|uniref:Uncharacterized protein n=1 Tax=Orchesella dallaii TaxID=48710 RepID=A0ABP1RRR4_9HEXA